MLVKPFPQTKWGGGGVYGSAFAGSDSHLDVLVATLPRCDKLPYLPTCTPLVGEQFSSVENSLAVWAGESSAARNCWVREASSNMDGRTPK